MPRKIKKPLRPISEQARPATGRVAEAPAIEAPQVSQRYRTRVLWVSLVLIAVTFAIYARTGRFSYIDLDDPTMVYSNPMVSHGITRDGILWAFTETKTFYWQPVTWLSHMLDCQVFGLNPGPHHLVNVGLHAINAALLFLLFFNLTGGFWRSALTAAIFAVHPLRVESVAWIAERRDVLSGLFSLITLLAYVRYTRARSRKLYVTVLAAFWLALMSKPMSITLPFAMLLMDYWPLKRFARRPARQLIVEKLPLFASAVLCAAITFAGNYSQGNPISLEILPFQLRLASAVMAYTGYLAKFVWPNPLSIFYPWQIPSTTALVTAGFVFVLLSGVAAWSLKRKPYIFAGWLWFVVLLVPVIGFVQVGWQYMADRFTYLPLVGPTFALVWLAADWLENRARLRQVFAAGAAVLILAFCAVSWVQTGYWRDKVTVYRHALDVDENNERMWVLLGKVLAENGNMGDAERAYREAIRLRPERADDRAALATLLMTQGRTAEAIDELRAVIRLEPENVPALKFLGLTLIQAGADSEAQEHLRAAERLAPADTEITRMLSMLSIFDPSKTPAAPPAVAVPAQKDEEEAPVPQGSSLHPLNTEQALEIGAMLAFAVIAVLWPAWGKRLLTRVERWMTQLANRPVRAMLCVALLPMVARLLFLPIYGIPQPAIADEFGHLLLADTFASGRLANPPHPMREHFESIYVLQSPSYTSIYPVGQGLILAIPKYLGMRPWLGVWITVGLMCAAIFWMLAGWMPARWALLGGFLAAMRLGVLSHWMNTYWGGAVAAIGGALVLGALPRIFRGKSAYNAAALGVGLAILAQTRPYEGFLLSIPVGLALALWVLRTKTLSWKQRFNSVVLPLTAVLLCAVAFTLYYNARVTGNPLELPYLLYQKLYGVPQAFYWQPPVPPGQSGQLPEIAANYQWQLDRYNVRHSFPELAKATAEKLESLWMFYLQPAWTLPLIALPFLWRDRRVRFLLLAGAFVLAGVALYPLLYPHYLAPICVVFIAIVVQGIRHLRCWEWRKRPVGASLAGAVLVLSATGLFTAPAGADLLSANLVTSRTPRSRILEKLAERGGQHVIIVHYGPNHLFHIGWIYNDANIDNSPVIWARDLGPAKNAELIDYYRGRNIWYFDADASQVHLAPYSPESAGSLSRAASPLPPPR